MAASVKMRAYWDIAPCSHVKFTDVSEVFTASIISPMSHRLDHGDSTHL
jgi:hypothetical protein